MNGYWNQIPLFRYLMPLIAGIILCLNFQISQQWPITIFYCLVLLYGILQVLKKTSASFALQPLHGILLQLTILFSGCTLVIKETPIYKHNYFMHQADSTSMFYCRITKPPEFTAKNIRLYAEVVATINNEIATNVIGKTILYIPIDSLQPRNINYGDELIIQNKFSLPAPPKNPHAFNYATYLANQKIYHTAFLKSGDFIFTENNSAKIIWQFIFQTKANFIASLERNIGDENALAVAQTLIIGQKSALDEEVTQAYANTGTMHILAVSGLHVGILFVILEMLFKPFAFFTKKQGNGIVIKTVLILIIIWIYTCLSGLSASVNRSAVMFSFLALGKAYEQQTNTFNILFLSMLILLVDDPYQITQVGFQLSYIAVGGIVFFQPYVSKLWSPKNVLLKYIWSMTSVSLAAQLATSPISFFYFHQFPNYFLLSNIVAIPVSFVVLVLGLAFFALGAVPFISTGIAFLLEWSLRIMNFAIIEIEQLPNSLTEGLYLETPDTIISYVALIYLGAFLALKEKRYLLMALISALILTSCISTRKISNNLSSKICFYSLKHQSAILFKRAEIAVLFTDTLPILETNEFEFQIKADFVAQGISDPLVCRFGPNIDSFSVAGCRFEFPYLILEDQVIFILTKQNRNVLPVDGDRVNYVLLTGNPYIKVENLLKTFPNAVFIADQTNSFKSNRYWTTQFLDSGVRFHSLRDKSALEVPL